MDRIVSLDQVMMRQIALLTQSSISTPPPLGAAFTTCVNGKMVMSDHGLWAFERRVSSGRQVSRPAER